MLQVFENNSLLLFEEIALCCYVSIILSFLGLSAVASTKGTGRQISQGNCAL